MRVSRLSLCRSSSPSFCIGRCSIRLLRFAPIEFDDAGAITKLEEIGEGPDRGIRVIGAAMCTEACGREGAELLFELGEAAGVMHLMLRIAHRNRLGPHGLAAAGADEADRHIGIGGL